MAALRPKGRHGFGTTVAHQGFVELRKQFQGGTIVEFRPLPEPIKSRPTVPGPEARCVDVQAYLANLETALQASTQWVVFEPNNEDVWTRVRRTLESRLNADWRSGRLQGVRPEEAYFVRCDRSTMTQNDLDNGRLVCEVGVAPVKPTEFVIIRIGQWTADKTT